MKNEQQSRRRASPPAALHEKPPAEKRTGAWVDVRTFGELRPTFKNRIRYLIEHAEPHFNAKGERVPGNGLARAIAKIGGRADRKYGTILIDLIEFDEWVDRQRLEPVNNE
jgi:hypothetical protein